VIGDWLEGVVTLCLLTREKEEFKELEGAALEYDPPSRNIPYSARCDGKARQPPKVFGAGRRLPRMAETLRTDIGANYLRNS
jgi:hypothetical protein